MSALDDFDAADKAAPAPQATGSALDAFDAAANAVSQPAPVAQPSTKTDRFVTGVGDLGYKAAQIMGHVLPAAAANGLNTFNQWVSDKTGADYVPVQDVDKHVDQREQQYQASRAAAGSTGFDWMRTGGNVANPVNWAIPGVGGVSTAARLFGGALQGAAASVLSTPTTGDDLNNFWGAQARLGAFGALGGGGATLGAEAAAPMVSKGATALRNLLNTGGRDVAPQADKITQQAFTAKGIDPTTVAPDMFNWFRTQVAGSLKAGKTPDALTTTNLAEAAALPVPVPLLKGQASRDPMQYALEQNLRGVTGVGEPITGVLGQQNKALIENIDRMGAKNAPNVVDAGARAIDTFQKLDQTAQQKVTDAYTAFRNATGRDLDVPMQGVAQDYARIAHDYGMETIPPGVRNHLNDYGLLTGTQQKTFTVQDAEGLLKVINKNYNRADPQATAALDELRRSIQGAITQGTSADAAGTEAAQLAANARKTAAQRFQMIDAIPAYKAAITGAEPDKFLQKYFWNGNVSQVAGMKQLLSLDPEALATVKGAVMGDLKQTALNNQTPENGIFSQAKYNGVIRDQNNAKRLSALFEPQEVRRLNSLGNVAEVAMVAPKASAVNTSNTASAAANLVQGAVKGGVGTQALTHVGGMDIPIASWAARAGAARSGQRSLADLVRNSTQPLTAADINAVNFLTKRSGAFGGDAAGQAQK